MSLVQLISVKKGDMFRLETVSDCKNEIIDSHGLRYVDARDTMMRNGTLGFDRLPFNYEQRQMMYITGKNNTFEVYTQVRDYAQLHHYEQLRHEDEDGIEN